MKYFLLQIYKGERNYVIVMLITHQMLHAFNMCGMNGKCILIAQFGLSKFLFVLMKKAPLQLK